MRTEILVTCGSGLLGYALKQILPDAVFVTCEDCDLTDVDQVRHLFETLKPKCVLHLAAQVGGVKMNALKNADLFEANIRMNTNVLSAAQQCGVSRLISVLSSCALKFYPDRPSTEDDLHVGLPFEGNLGYGYSKRALDVQTKLLWKQYACQYSSVMPVTMYGPNDNWDLDDGHVIAALIHKCFLAKQRQEPLEVWGSGHAIRQFVFSLDVARLLSRALSVYWGPETVIIVPHDGIPVRELAFLIARAMDFRGPVVFNERKPEGELLRVVRSNLFPKLFRDFQFTPLDKGLKTTIEWFCNHYSPLREASV